jgi:Domain of unknown function (DUF5615)
VKLLLDVHHSRRAAERMRIDGHDVIAAADNPGLARLPDEEILAESTNQNRMLVTENSKDFDPILRAWASAGRHHAGVIFTSPRRFDRSRASYPQNLVKSLTLLLVESPDDQTDWVQWLA